MWPALPAGVWDDFSAEITLERGLQTFRTRTAFGNRVGRSDRVTSLRWGPISPNLSAGEWGTLGWEVHVSATGSHDLKRSCLWDSVWGEGSSANGADLGSVL